jgi:hypothetical protein
VITTKEQHNTTAQAKRLKMLYLIFYILHLIFSYFINSSHLNFWGLHPLWLAYLLLAMTPQQSTKITDKPGHTKREQKE